jgi:hypothetical protein
VPPDPPRAGPDPQLVDCLPQAVRLELVTALEARGLTGSDPVLLKDLPNLRAETREILQEFHAATPALNVALRQARVRLGLTDPADTYRRQPRDMGLPVEVREMMDDWERRALVENRG